MKHNPIERAFLDFDLVTAEAEAKKALANKPNDPETQALLGLVYVYSQREPEALQILASCKSSKRFKNLAQHLVNHFHCRQEMARKLGVKNDPATHWLAQAREISGLEPDSNVGITVSACLIVKNEEANLGRCLASIKDLVDQIVVVDTGSTDGTIDIARRFGATIGNFEWCDDFALARNASLDLGNGHWALWIDADEEIPPDSVQAIRESLMRPQFAGFDIPIVNFMADEGAAEQYRHAPTRLFRLTPETRFVGRIHEQVAQSLADLKLPIAMLENATILHHGYRPSEMQAKGKIERTISLLHEDLREHPNDAFQWFNLGNALAIAGRFDEAQDACRSAIERLQPSDPFGQTLYHIYADTLLIQDRPQETLAVCDEADAKQCGGILVEFARASALTRLERHEEGLEAAERCREAIWPLHLSGDYTIYQYKRDLLKCQILMALRRYVDAEAALEPLFSVESAGASVAIFQGAIWENQGRLRDAEAHYEAWLVSDGNEEFARGYARVVVAQGRPNEAIERFRALCRENPGNLAAWCGWIEVVSMIDDPEETLYAFSSLAEHHTPSAAVYVNWGRTLERCGRQEEALDRYSKALELDPTEANALFNAGDLLYKMGLYEDAVHTYQAGVRARPDYAQGWFVLGNALMRMGVPRAAVVAYQQCLSVDPTHAEAQSNIELANEQLQHAA